MPARFTLKMNKFCIYLLCPNWPIATEGIRLGRNEKIGEITI